MALSGEEHSRVQAHMDGDEFSAHILTDEAEYNVEVILKFMKPPHYLHSLQISSWRNLLRFFSAVVGPKTV